MDVAVPVAGVCGVGASPPPAHLGRGEGEHLADRVVELADAREPGREGDGREVEVGRLDQHTSGLGPLGPGDGQRPGAELGPHQPLELAHAVAEPAGQAVDALAVDDTVGDGPHGPGHDVGADVPLGRAGRRVGAAPTAGPEAGLLRGGRGGVEAHVRRLGRDGRAARTAVDAGRGDAGRRSTRRSGGRGPGRPGSRRRSPRAPDQQTPSASFALAGLRHRWLAALPGSRERRARYRGTMARRTKIIATIGPASDSEATLKDLIAAGMDVARIGLAHESLDDALERFRRIRAAAASLDREVGILADLPGPKVRAGHFPEGGVVLTDGDLIRLAPGHGPSTAEVVQVDYDDLHPRRPPRRHARLRRRRRRGRGRRRRRRHPRGAGHPRRSR